MLSGIGHMSNYACTGFTSPAPTFIWRHCKTLNTWRITWLSTATLAVRTLCWQTKRCHQLSFNQRKIISKRSGAKQAKSKRLLPKKRQASATASGGKNLLSKNNKRKRIITNRTRRLKSKPRPKLKNGGLRCGKESKGAWLWNNIGVT